MGWTWVLHIDRCIITDVQSRYNNVITFMPKEDDVQIHMYVRPEFRDAVKEAAKADNRSMQNYIINAIKKQMERDDA